MKPSRKLSKAASKETAEKSAPETRWQRKRGGYMIEHQCLICGWWFDTFDPERYFCDLCLGENETQSFASNSAMMMAMTNTPPALPAPPAEPPSLAANTLPPPIETMEGQNLGIKLAPSLETLAGQNLGVKLAPSNQQHIRGGPETTTTATTTFNPPTDMSISPAQLSMNGESGSTPCYPDMRAAATTAAAGLAASDQDMTTSTRAEETSSSSSRRARKSRTRRLGPTTETAYTPPQFLRTDTTMLTSEDETTFSSAETDVGSDEEL